MPFKIKEFTPDYDPAPEKHAGRKWMIKPALNPHMKFLELNGKKYRFNKDGNMVVKDQVVARALQQKYGMDIAVGGVRYPHMADRGHRYFFTSPGMPWHKYDELGKRILKEE